MRISRRVAIQLVIFAIITAVAGSVMVFGYIKIPAMLGLGRYTVTVELSQSAGLYRSGNVTYRGTKVGKVKSIELTDNGHVRAILSLDSAVPIPSNLTAEVHSQSAIGEQYLALAPRDDTSAPLKGGEVIPVSDTSVPPPIDGILDAVNRGLLAIPNDNLKTAVDESFIAFGGLGPELARIVNGSTDLIRDARANLPSLTTVIDQSAPVLDSQTDTAADIRAWAAHLADVTQQLRSNDSAVQGVLTNAAPAADEARQLVDRLQPTLPVILANLVSLGHVAVTYNSGIEQLLVLVPQVLALTAGAAVPNRYNRGHPGGYLDFNLNVNLPPPCVTGFLPPSQQRGPASTDAPERIEGDLYCRIPQDAPQNVRGARNLPCVTRPGKRAPTVKMCESDEQYVPLNDGWNWKGDPNATLSGQDVPQLPPGSPSRGGGQGAGAQPIPPLAAAEYDPATGSYVGPDGNTYTQSDLAQSGPTDKSWQSMLVPPGLN